MSSWRRVAPHIIENTQGEQIHGARGADGVQYRAARGGSKREGPNFIGPWRRTRRDAERDLLRVPWLGWRRLSAYSWGRASGARMSCPPQEVIRRGELYLPEFPSEGGLTRPYIAISPDGVVLCSSLSFAGASNALDDVLDGRPPENGYCWCDVARKQQGAGLPEPDQPVPAAGAPS